MSILCFKGISIDEYDSIEIEKRRRFSRTPCLGNISTVTVHGRLVLNRIFRCVKIFANKQRRPTLFGL